MKKVVYREAKKSDVHELIGLAMELFLESPNYSSLKFSAKETARSFLKLIIAENGSVFVAEENENIIGFIAGHVSGYLFSEQLMAVEDTWFVTRSRRDGLAGLRLLRIFTAWGKDRGSEEIQFGTSTGIAEARACKLFDHLGFSPAGKIFKRGY